ncbi:MAG: ABC transporter substrate-binding protein [Granulosicoccus sp.]
MKKHYLGGLAFLATSMVTTPALAGSDGVFENRIVVGQSAAFTGPADALGLGMKIGLQAAFAEANDAGGVNGRKIELVAYDDGYEPDKAISNTKKLIENDKVFALIGAVGTPTSKAAQPIAKSAKVPFIGPFTGAGFLRNPDNAHVVNVRGTYDQETEDWIKHLTEDLDAKKIAILYQDDSFGRVGLAGVQKALDKRGMTLAAEGTFKRNSVAVKSALLKIRKAKPDAVVMVGSYKPIAAFVKLAKKVRMKSQFVTISFVGSKALAAELGNVGEGVVVTQVVPFYEDKSLPLVDSYHKALASIDASDNAGFVSLEGYLVGRVFVDSLKTLGRNVSRDAFVQAFQNSLTLDMGGVTLSYGPGDNQGMDRTYLSVLQKDGSFIYVDKLGQKIVSAESSD